MTHDYHLTNRLVLPLPRSTVFPFFASARNLARITPPELAFRLTTEPPVVMHQGALIDYVIRIAGMRVGWRSEISRWDPPHEFVDRQLVGPYARWVHTHRFHEVDGQTIIEDVVEYRLPFGRLGRLVHPLVRRQLDRIFLFRSEAVRQILCPAPSAPVPPTS